MQVNELMTTELATVGRNDDLLTAVEIMLDRHIGSVVVGDDDGSPIGIVTKSDALRAVAEADTRLQDLGVSAVMSSPLETVQATATVQTALREMAESDIKRLVVVENMALVGIVTMTDIATHLPEEVAAVRNNERQRHDWTDE